MDGESKDKEANDVETVNEWGVSDGVDEGASDGAMKGPVMMVWK